jgi:hypothetical protein
LYLVILSSFNGRAQQVPSILNGWAWLWLNHSTQMMVCGAKVCASHARSSKRWLVDKVIWVVLAPSVV